MKEFEDLKELLNEEDIDFNLDIEKEMNYKLSAKIIQVLACIGLVIALVLSGFHFITKLTHYNPHKTTIEFKYLLQSYIWLYYPDVNFRPYYVEEFDDQYFGKYIYHAEFDNGFDYNWIGDNPTELIIDNSIDLSSLHAISPIISNKYDRNQDYSYNNNPLAKVEVIKELDKLPDSTYIDATLLFIDAISLEEVTQMMHKYPNTDFIWCAIEPYKEIQTLTTGIPLQTLHSYEPFSEAFVALLKNYEKDIPTVTELTQKYNDMLDVLLYNKETYELLTQNEPNRSYYHLNNQRAYIRENLNSIGLRIYTNKQDLIEMIKDKNCSFVWIEDMKLSKLAK